MKRLGIFFFYEKNGDVDDFITYYLADLNKNLTELVVVCNGKLSEQGRAAFSQFTDNIIVRENKGLDVWAYKTALDSYGWAKLSEFDEIVMTNSTLMGPVRPLKEMFDAMWENQDLDFWGLSIHHGAKSNPFKGKHLYNYLPVHIQSHFIVYRRRFVQNPELQAYWDNMPMIESYTDSVQRYEAIRCSSARRFYCGRKNARCSSAAALCTSWRPISTTRQVSRCRSCTTICGTRRTIRWTSSGRT